MNSAETDLYNEHFQNRRVKSTGRVPIFIRLSFAERSRIAGVSETDREGG